MDPNTQAPRPDITPPKEPLEAPLTSAAPAPLEPTRSHSAPFAPQPVSAETKSSRANPSKPRGHQGFHDLLSIIAVLVSALLLAFVLISFVFQSYQVDGESMETTLHNNDHLLVWKVPRTIARITHHAYIPNRGDVVIFNDPDLPQYSAEGSRQLIKRVIGLPGDRVVVRDGTITVYNSEHPEGFQPDKTLPYNQDNHIPTTAGNVDITLKKDQLYVCGDNRGNSLDSRIFGPIEASNIVGKLAVRVLPLNSVKRF